MGFNGKNGSYSYSYRSMIDYLMETHGVDKYVAREIVNRANTGYCDLESDAGKQRVTVLDHQGLLRPNRYTVVDI